MENTEKRFLALPLFASKRQQLLNSSYKRHFSLQNLSEKPVIDTLLYGSDKFNEYQNKEMLFHAVNYIRSSKCLERPLTEQC